MKNADVNQSILKSSQAHKKYLLFILLVVSGMFFTSCNNSDGDPSPSSSNTVCKIQTQTATGTGRESATVTYTYDYAYTYTYDEKGNELSLNANYNYNYSDGKKTTSSSVSNSQFDAKDFLIRRIFQYSSTDKDGKVSNQSNNTEYEYKNERLSKEITTSTYDGKTKSYNFSYEYDTDGKLIKFSNTYNNSYTKFEYSGNGIQKITTVDVNGNSNSPFLEYNKDGLLVKSIETRGSVRDENRYEYDAEGQITRSERYINTKPSSAYSNEYDNKENPLKNAYTKYKGHPMVPETRAIYTVKHNLTKTINFSANAMTGQWESNGSTIYTYDYNGKNLPVDVNYKSLDKDGIQTYSNKTSYQYQDCQ